MIVSILAALDDAGGIGKDNRIPWKAPADLQWFKRLTMGHHLVMGRKTWESIGKPLPGRTSIVLTRNPAYQAQGALITHSLDEAIQRAAEDGDDEVFIIGGADVFRQSLSLSDQLYLTRVHTSSSCDAFFPSIDSQEWDLVEEKFQPADEKNPIDLTFTIYRRKKVNASNR